MGVNSENTEKPKRKSQFAHVSTWLYPTPVREGLDLQARHPHPPRCGDAHGRSWVRPGAAWAQLGVGGLSWSLRSPPRLSSDLHVGPCAWTSPDKARLHLPRQTALGPPPTPLTCAGPSRGRAHEAAGVSVLEGLTGQPGNRPASSAHRRADRPRAAWLSGRGRHSSRPRGRMPRGTRGSPEPRRRPAFTAHVASAHASRGRPA